MKVVVTTIVALNPGDAAILLGTIRLVQQAFGESVEIVCVDKNATVSARLYPWVRFSPSLFSTPETVSWRRKVIGWGYGHRLRRFDEWRLRVAARLVRGRLPWIAAVISSRDERETLSHYCSADLVLASGGTYLVPSYGLLQHVLEYEAVAHCRRPLAFMPQSMGPFGQSDIDRRLARIFRNSAFVCVRDRQSADNLRAIGAWNEHCRIVPDAAFALASPTTDAARPPAAGRTTPRVAISVRARPHGIASSAADAPQAYIDSIRTLTEWLVNEARASVTFVSSCQGIPEYWTDDSRLAAEIVGGLAEKTRAHTIVDGAFREPQALLDHLSGYDVVVATRMHVAILAACVGTPVVPIAYEFKTNELFRAMGLPDLPVDYETGTAEQLIQRVSSILTSPAAARIHQLAGRDGLLQAVSEMPTLLVSAATEVHSPRVTQP